MPHLSNWLRLRRSPAQEHRSANSAPLLCDLPPDKVGYVQQIQTNGLLRRRLLDLGFVPGAEVQVSLQSPAGDPTVYRVRGTSIALRRADAAYIHITYQPEAAETFKPADDGCRQGCSYCPVHPEASRPPNVTAKEFVVALAGNPNTGKSTVFNALTGLRQHVGNWPGKTVARAEGTWNYAGGSFKLVDLPGTYSLLSTSTDEEIARDFLLFSQPDCTVAVVDATCLERNLNLVFQILEITDGVVVCVNLMDEAAREGISVDIAALEATLGVPVVGTAARSGRGLDLLKKSILDVASGAIETQPFRVPYEPSLQRAIDDLLPYVRRALPEVPNERWIAMRLIDGGDTRLRERILDGSLNLREPTRKPVQSRTKRLTIAGQETA